MKKFAALLALALAAVALVACGDDDNGTTTTTTDQTTQEETGGGAEGEGAAGGAEGGAGGGGSTISFEADPNGALAYTTDEVIAKAGDITMDFSNPQALQHDVAIEDPSGGQVGKTELISDSSTSATLKDVKPGEYTFYCTVPGHREAGMEGTLNVE